MPSAVAARLGGRRPGRASGGVEEPGPGRGRGPARPHPAEAVEEADLVMILAPDHVQRHLYTESVEPHLVDGDALFFGHGFNIRFGYITPPDGRRRLHGRPQGPGPPGAPRVRRRPRRARARRGREGRHRQGLGPRALLRQGASAACARAGSRRRSPRRPRPTCSASRPCSAAAPPSWCSTASRCSPRPATSPRSPTSSACTSSS